MCKVKAEMLSPPTPTPFLITLRAPFRLSNLAKYEKEAECVSIHNNNYVSHHSSF